MNYTPNKITIHCSDTDNLKTISITALEKDHIARGFGGIGYHMVIQPDGEVVNTRALNIPGCHVAGHNTGNIGICLVGRDKFSVHQFEAMRNQCESLMQIYQINLWNIFTHNQWDSAIKQGKSCPNLSINKIIYFLCTNNFKCLVENISAYIG